jgi:hypothetical protein
VLVFAKPAKQTSNQIAAAANRLANGPPNADLAVDKSTPFDKKSGHTQSFNKP